MDERDSARKGAVKTARGRIVRAAEALVCSLSAANRW